MKDLLTTKELKVAFTLILKVQVNYKNYFLVLGFCNNVQMKQVFANCFQLVGTPDRYVIILLIMENISILRRCPFNYAKIIINS